MDKFFKSLKYYSVQLFANILIGIAFILIAYPIWAFIFFHHIEALTYIITLALSWIIYFIGAIIRDDNEKEYNRDN